MKVEVLLSCMNQTDWTIIQRSNLQSDAVIINQANINKTENTYFTNKKGERCCAKCITTTQRGLSASRNLAIANSTAEICVISDDDEIFSDDYVDTIINAYNTYPHFDLLFFEIGGRDGGKKGFRKDLVIGKWHSLKICSVQMTFRRIAILSKQIKFNPRFGAGISKAGGEEHIFMFDCFKAGFKARNIPIEIATLIQDSPSTWRGIFDPEFYIDEGKVLRKLFGPIIGLCAVMYFTIKNYKRHAISLSPFSRFRFLLKGLYSHEYQAVD